MDNFVTENRVKNSLLNEVHRFFLLQIEDDSGRSIGFRAADNVREKPLAAQYCSCSGGHVRLGDGVEGAITWLLL